MFFPLQFLLIFLNMKPLRPITAHLWQLIFQLHIARMPGCVHLKQKKSLFLGQFLTVLDIVQTASYYLLLLCFIAQEGIYDSRYLVPNSLPSSFWGLNSPCQRFSSKIYPYLYLAAGFQFPKYVGLEVWVSLRSQNNLG